MVDYPHHKQPIERSKNRCCRYSSPRPPPQRVGSSLPYLRVCSSFRVSRWLARWGLSISNRKRRLICHFQRAPGCDPGLLRVCLFRTGHGPWNPGLPLGKAALTSHTPSLSLRDRVQCPSNRLLGRALPLA